MSLIAIAAATDADVTIPNLPFFPAIKVGDVRAEIRVDGTVTPQRFRDALLAAMFSVNHELVAWRIGKEDAGYAALADVPADMLGDEHRLVHLYKRAVKCAMKAELLERYRDIDTARIPGTTQKEKDLTEEIDEYRRDMRWAIRDILGVSRATVELL